MSVTRIPRDLHEDEAFEAHETDHVIAEQHGGTTTADNLAFACWECNRRKGPNLSSVDSAAGEVTRLFNPRRDRWDENFLLEGARIVARTPIGRATVALLRLNSPENLALRTSLREIGRYPAR